MCEVSSSEELVRRGMQTQEPLPTSPAYCKPPVPQCLCKQDEETGLGDTCFPFFFFFKRRGRRLPLPPYHKWISWLCTYISSGLLSSYTCAEREMGVQKICRGDSWKG